MKNNVYLLLAVIGFLVACNNNTDKQAEPVISESTDAVSGENATSLNDREVEFINGTDFSKYAREHSPEIKWSNFNLARFWKEELRVKTDFKPDSNFMDTYGKLLKYSPDSSKFIDLDSYNISIHKDKQGRLIGNEAGPDTEVSLVDLVSLKKMRLVFVGPGSSVEDAGWLDNNNFILIGFQENEAASGTEAVIWHFDLEQQLVKQYELNDQSQIKSLEDYSRKVRLKNVNFK
jgi:hypothetical protein